VQFYRFLIRIIGYRLPIGVPFSELANLQPDGATRALESMGVSACKLLVLHLQSLSGRSSN